MRACLFGPSNLTLFRCSFLFYFKKLIPSLCLPASLGPPWWPDLVGRAGRAGRAYQGWKERGRAYLV